MTASSQGVLMLAMDAIQGGAGAEDWRSAGSWEVAFFELIYRLPVDRGTLMPWLQLTTKTSCRRAHHPINSRCLIKLPRLLADFAVFPSAWKRQPIV
jgi:hypothetical protein